MAIDKSLLSESTTILIVKVLDKADIYGYQVVVLALESTNKIREYKKR